MGTNKNSIRMYGIYIYIYTYIWIVLVVNTLNTLGVIKIDTNDTSKLTIHVGKYTILIGCLGMGGCPTWRGEILDGSTKATQDPCVCMS